VVEQGVGEEGKGRWKRGRERQGCRITTCQPCSVPPRCPRHVTQEAAHFLPLALARTQARPSALRLLLALAACDTGRRAVLASGALMGECSSLLTRLLDRLRPVRRSKAGFQRRLGPLRFELKRVPGGAGVD
jgi:hypothetical protein